jgi:protein-disulfide isomerase
MIRLTTLCAALLLPLGAAAQSTDGMEMSAEERAAFRAEVRAYLLDNPEVIMEAIQILEERRNAAARQDDAAVVAEHAEALFDDGFSYVGGNPDGEITLVEFSDYRCGYCKRAHPIVTELLEREPDLRFVLKEFPILGPESVTAGRMALAALDLDRARYRALHDALMTHEGGLTEAAAYRMAAEIGYDIPALKARAADPEIEARLRETYELASALGLQGTPSFVIGGQILRGFVPLEQMAAVLEEERAALAD